MTDPKDVARQALACLDLTNLNEDCTEEDIIALCTRAKTVHGPTAAICVWPGFVRQGANLLATSGIRVATVVNFPSGMEPIEDVTEMTAQAVADGADEIDMVIPYPKLMEGHAAEVSAAVARVVAAANGCTVKAILETGILEEESLIRTAAEQALAGGADFLKTSTGKVPVNATLPAARIMLEVIKASGEPVGFKPAGGIKTTADAAAYLSVVEDVMGQGWANPATFRLGASSVLDGLLATLNDQATPRSSAGGY